MPKKKSTQPFEIQQRQFVIKHLRKASLYWPARTEAKNLARRERGRYECYVCHNLFKNGEYDMDHISPIVKTATGFTDYNEYINGLLCRPDQFGLICKLCHSVKTEIENQTRDSFAKKRRELDKKIKKAAKN